MTRSRPSPAAQLAAIYASLPEIECRGQCQNSCGSIGMTRLEQARISQRHGRTLPLVAAFDAGCPALTILGRCSVYADRPMVCRLWGLVPSMRCEHGCLPEGGELSEEQGRRLMAQVVSIGRRAAA